MQTFLDFRLCHSDSIFMIIPQIMDKRKLHNENQQIQVHKGLCRSKASSTVDTWVVCIATFLLKSRQTSLSVWPWLSIMGLNLLTRGDGSRVSRM